ncbi:MAG: pilus assembly protein PilM [Candidatus Falkowbacteria bacterium]|nr:MAG: pilus assembly protein PilM [Candidatus Falkowbacteria bacterium]
MGLGKIFSRADTIGGLEISDDALRFSSLKKGRLGLETEILVEEKLNGQEQSFKSSEFVAKLIKFSRKNHIKYIIASIPTNNIFVKLYNFPANISKEKINESMELNIELQLPQKKSDIYCDWMEIEKNDISQKILLSYIKKDYAENLVNIFKKAGLKLVALEGHSLSLSRIIKQTKDEALLLLEKGGSDISFSVIMNNNLLFSQSVPREKIGDNLKGETDRVINYHGWFGINIKQLALLGDFSASEIKKMALKPITLEKIDSQKNEKINPKFFTVLGAAKRGLIPRKDDVIISLMEIGTEKAYAQEKANLNANFFIGTSAVLAAFFVLIFFATWSFMSIMQNNYNKRISSLSLLPGSENGILLKEKADNFNNLISEASAMGGQEVVWSKVLEEIKSKTNDNVKINTLSLPDATGLLTISGTAKDRDSINNFKKSFEDSNLFTDINIPLNNLGKKEDIPFSLTFKIKNSELIHKQ